MPTEVTKTPVEIAKELSEKTKIAYTNLLSAYILEEALNRIASSVFSERFLLRDLQNLGLNQYSRRIVHELAFYCDEKLFTTRLSQALASVFLSNNEGTISWNGKFSNQGKQKRSLLLEATVGQVVVPIQIHFLMLKDFPQMEREELHLETLHPNMEVRRYPKEIVLADSIIEVVKKLELINDMSYYDKCYQILSTETVDGRRMQECLAKKIKSGKLLLENGSIDRIVAYKNYKFMEKKWKKYKKQQGHLEIQWEELVEVVTCFFNPIWNALLKDEIFFGDWMPELKRFI